MTNKDLTFVGVLVDESGSMGRIRNDMEAGVNHFIKTQWEAPGGLLFALAGFSYGHKLHVPFTYAGDGAAPRYDLNPSGGTALNDAVGWFITEVGRYLKFLPEKERPGKVVIVIGTDGEENSSKEYSLTQVKELIAQQKDQWKWEFVFLGKDIDSFAVGGGLGVLRGQTINFESPQAVFAATSANIGTYRATHDAAALSYTDEQRDGAKK